MAKKGRFELNNGESLDRKTAKDLRYIKFEGDNDALFWRFTADVLNPDAEIIVPETHVVIYVKDGVLMDDLQGGRYPIFDYKKGIFFKRKVGAASVDLVFISKTARLKVKWGTPTRFAFRDEFTDVLVHIGAYGELEMKVGNPRLFYKDLVASDRNFSIADLQERILQRLLSQIEPIVYQTLRDKHIPFEEITIYKNSLAQELLPAVDNLFKDYGLEAVSFTISQISPTEEEIALLEEKRKELQSKIEEKADAKELAAELERLSDKEFEREQLLRRLESQDIDKYYEVLKILGWPRVPAAQAAPAPQVAPAPKLVCPTCHKVYGPNIAFCPEDGTRLVPDNICPKCHRQVSKDAIFCPSCGQKIR